MIRRIERAEGTRFQVYGRRDGEKVYVGTFDNRLDVYGLIGDARSTP